MKKRFIGTFLLGAVTIASTSTLVSCKDYDDDISNLQAQINSLDAIKSAFNDGIIIKNVSQDGNGVVLTLSNGDTYRVSNGTNGTDADVWTIGSDGFWYKNGAKTDYKATGSAGQDGKDGQNGKDGQDGKDGQNGKDGQDGKDGKDGIYYEPNADGFFYSVDPATGEKTKTNVQWSQASGISAAQTRRGVVLNGVDGYPTGLFLPTVQDLTSLVFIPDHYYWGVEATTIKSLTTDYYEPIRPLTTWIKEDEVTQTYAGIGTVATVNSQEYVGRRNDLTSIPVHNHLGCKESEINNYQEAGELADHERYPVKGTYTVLLNARARYHVNPTSANLEDASVSIIDADKKYTRAENAAGGPSAAGISLQGNASGDNREWYVEDGVLTVPLHINNTGALKKVVDLTTTNPNDGVTIFATQVTWNNGGVADTTVTSDYATLCEETVKDLRLSHTKHNRAGSSDVDFIQTKMFNLHCGDCTLPAITYADGTRQAAYSHKGMHLFATIAEAEDYVVSTRRIDDASYTGEGQDLVGFNENINLNKLVETHYTNTFGNHDVFDAEDLDKYFYYRFSLTSFIIGGNKTNESAHACILSDENGISWLHPLDPMDGGLLGRDPSVLSGLEDWSKTTEVVVNRVPLVRVELVSKDGDHVVDYGYIPIRITKAKKVDPVKPETSVTFESYKIGDVSAKRYANCHWVVDGGYLLTNWRQTEEDLFPLANKKLGDDYDILDRITFEEKYDIDQTGGICNQYYFDSTTNTWKPVSSGGEMSVGEIKYLTDTSDDGTHTSIFEWVVSQNDIQTLAASGATSVRRAVKFNSRDAVNYPVIYVVFETGKISMKDIKVTSDVKLKSHIIKEYLYAANSSTLGDDEIHTNVLTPEENVGNRSDITYDYNGFGLLWDDLGNDRNKDERSKPYADPVDLENAWKPAYMDNKFSDVFVGNLRAGNNPVTWVQTGMTAEEGESVPAAVSGVSYDLDFVFDASNENYHPKGYTDNSGNAKTFNLKVSSDKKVLYAYLPSAPLLLDTIAEIVVDGANDDYQNRWSNLQSRIQKMRIDYKRQTKYGYAESLLNYKAHDELDDDVVKATVALEAWANYVNEPNKCHIDLTNNTFDVRFLRPISIIPGSGADFTDAYVTGDGAQVIPISALQPSYSDWRDSKATRVTNPSWKTAPNYDQYYAQNGESTIKFKLAFEFVNGTPISNDRNVTTDLNGNADAPVSLQSVSDQVDLKYYDSYTDPGTGNSWNEPVLVYRNLSSTVDEFHVFIPVEVDYYWGKYYDKTTITIKKTVGNARQR